MYMGADGFPPRVFLHDIILREFYMSSVLCSRGLKHNIKNHNHKWRVNPCDHTTSKAGLFLAEA